MKVLCVTHFLGDVMGSLGDVLRDRGCDVTLVRADQGSVTGIDPKEHDVAVIMGGPMGVYQSDIFPWIKDEIKYAEARMKDDLPILGVCLGSQIMATALGSTVYKGEQGSELGWHPVTVSEAGRNTPVRYFDRAYTSMMHWHGDTYALPQGAELLASSEKYKVQAYKYGKRAMAVQFHPEMTESLLNEWIMVGDFYYIEKYICPLPEFRAQSAQHVKTLQAQTGKFFNEWLDQVKEK